MYVQAQAHVPMLYTHNSIFRDTCFLLCILLWALSFSPTLLYFPLWFYGWDSAKPNHLCQLVVISTWTARGRLKGRKRRKGTCSFLFAPFFLTVSLCNSSFSWVMAVSSSPWLFWHTSRTCWPLKGSSSTWMVFSAQKFGPNSAYPFLQKSTF